MISICGDGGLLGVISDVTLDQDGSQVVHIEHHVLNRRVFRTRATWTIRTKAVSRVIKYDICFW